MSTTYHIIQKQVFDIGFPVKEKAFELQNRFSRLFYNDATPVMEEVFGQLIPEGLVLRLDALSLDLGRIREDRLEKDFRERFKQALEKELELALREYARQAAPGKNKSLTDLLEYFLMTGSLPWWAAGELLVNPGVVIDRLIRDDPSGLKDSLLYAGQRDYVRKRLVFQFSVATIRSVVEVLEPDEAAFIFVYRTDIIRIQEAEQVFRQEISEFEKNLWVFILTYLLVDRGSNFNRKIFVKSTLSQMARQYNTEYVTLIALLFRALESAGLALIRRSPLSEIIHTLFYEEEKETEKSLPPNSAGLIKEKMNTIRFYLLHGSLTGQGIWHTVASLSVMFTELMTQAPESTQDMIRSVSEQEGIWTRIVQTFDEEAVKSLIRLREPGESEYIFHYAKKLETLQRQKFLVKTDSSSFHQSVWELILGFLWTERGNVFNTRTFLEYNIRRLSRRHHLSYRQLLAFLVQGIGQDIRSDRDSSLFHSLALLLKENTEVPPPPPPNPAEPSPATRAEPPSPNPAELAAPNPAEPASPSLPSSGELLSMLAYYLIHRRWPEKWKSSGQPVQPGQLPEEILLQQILQQLFREQPLALMQLLWAEGQQVSHSLLQGATRPIVQKAIRALFGSTPVARHTVFHIIRVAGEEPLRLLLAYMGKEWDNFIPAPQASAGDQLHSQAPPGDAHPRLPANPEPNEATDRAELIAIERELQRQHEQTAAANRKKYLEKVQAGEGPVYIQNAGLVLLHPLLTHFFSRLGLTEKNQFTGEAAQHRSAHLLQFLADGGQEHPEHQLVLNKILCNIPIEQPIPLQITIIETERAVAAELLEVVRQRWEKMKNTSIEGLQLSFLQRGGAITATPDGWKLRVEQKGIDVLLQYLPWSWGMIRLPWMNKTLYTEWI
jgi:Contractile injection system tape measure protein